MRALIAFFMVVSLAGPAGAQAWRDTDLGQGIREGVATREHIWLLGSTGNVVRFVRRTGERETIAGNVQDIAADNGHLWALIQADDTASWSIRDLRGRASRLANSPPGRIASTSIPAKPARANP